MKMVIEIDDIAFQGILRLVSAGEGSASDIAIASGTPLPKGHGDLIDKDKYKKWIETQDGDILMTEYYLEALDAQDTIVGGSHDGDIDYSLGEKIRTSEDCISREEAIRVAEQGQIQGYEWQFKKLCNLPSVQPQLYKAESENEE